jgi:hypothetical protein
MKKRQIFLSVGVSSNILIKVILKEVINILSKIYSVGVDKFLIYWDDVVSILSVSNGSAQHNP